jgi:hypothetical protein
MTTDNSGVSDGYHTFEELYNHRHCLFLALMRSHPKLSWRAVCHADGTHYKGWIICGMHLPTGDITYHLPAVLWSKLNGCGITTSTRAPEWDGHTSQDVITRLDKWLSYNMP